MFESDVLNKIVDFIKKSPIGATSSEISRFLNSNRITTTKYLAIAREKSLIDYKMYGMAKLWYIPAEINRETFFRDLLMGVVAKLDESEMEKIKEVSMSMAKEIVRIYKNFYKAEKLNQQQIIDSIIDVGNKIGGSFSVLEKNENFVVLRNKKNIFGNGIKDPYFVQLILSDICGCMFSQNLGYGKVAIKKSFSLGDNEDLIWVYLKKTEAVIERTVEYN